MTDDRSTDQSTTRPNSKIVIGRWSTIQSTDPLNSKLGSKIFFNRSTGQSTEPPTVTGFENFLSVDFPVDQSQTFVLPRFGCRLVSRSTNMHNQLVHKWSTVRWTSIYVFLMPKEWSTARSTDLSQKPI